MSEDTVEYGPLSGLVGCWKGDKGIDISPEPDDGIERNPFHETLNFEAIGDVVNAEKQTLAILRYHQAVYRQSNDEQFHDQFGYLTWDAATGDITHSFIIPRGVAVVAGGKVAETTGSVITFQFDAAEGDPEAVSQSPFMRDNARTVSFHQTLVLDGDLLSYEETTVLDIYGRTFNHKDKSKLQRVS